MDGKRLVGIKNPQSLPTSPQNVKILPVMPSWVAHRPHSCRAITARLPKRRASWDSIFSEVLWVAFAHVPCCKLDLCGGDGVFLWFWGRVVVCVCVVCFFFCVIFVIGCSSRSVVLVVVVLSGIVVAGVAG